jgi:uncharacterized protein (TIGR04255 family)
VSCEGRIVSDSQQPPVNEVVLSIGLAPQDQLVGPRMATILGDWLSEYPETQLVPPYEIPIENDEGFYAGPAFQVMLGGRQRYWLTSADRPYLLQVQNNYVALNWRRRDPDSEYVRYDAIRKQFDRFLSDIASALESVGGSVVPHRAELTYIDLIQPNDLWTGSSDTHRLFAVGFPRMSEAEAFSVAYSRSLRAAETWIGRLHVSLQTARDPLKNEAQLALNITTRSGNLADSTVNGAMMFLDQAHVAANDMFQDLLTPEAKEMWDIR